MACVGRHGNRFLVRFNIDGGTRRTTLHRDVDRETAEYMARQAEGWLRHGEPWESVRQWLRSRPVVQEPAEFDDVVRYFRTAIGEARKRAAKKGIPFDLAVGDAEDMLGDGTCQLTEIPFSLEKIGKRRPFAPSLDRVTAETGYVRSNVRIVCVAVNLAINEWGESLFAYVAEQFISRRQKKSMPRGGPPEPYKTPQAIDFTEETVAERTGLEPVRWPSLTDPGRQALDPAGSWGASAALGGQDLPQNRATMKALRC